MSHPRFVVPGAIVFVTRRCLERRYFLRPDAGLRRLVEYLFAVGCERFGLEPIAVCCLSNHYHAVLHDPFGRYPAFLQWFHCMMAKAVNARRGRNDRFWDAGRTNVCIFGGADDVLDKLVYLLANPTAAGLVADGRDWPGLRSAPGACAAAKPKIIQRPKGAFFADSTLPETVELRYVVPPTHAHMTREEFAKLLSDRVREHEAKLAAKARAEGHRFPGARGVQAQRWNDAPKTREVWRGVVPRVMARDKTRRIELLSLLAMFTSEYAEALESFRSGDREVVFPHGTWLMKQRYDVAVHPPPEA